MTALAQILQARGVEVLGSDTEEKFFTDEVLEKLKIPVIKSFSTENLPGDANIFIHSAAYTKENNAEVAEAESRGVPVITYPEALAELFNNSYGIAVCGSHGKSTTSAMLGCILEQAGCDPTVVVGSRINQWGSNARAGKGEYFVIEADEYKEAFLRYSPKMIVLTNIDYDHPDYFKDEHAYRNAFQKFLFENIEAEVIDGRSLEKEEKLKLKLPGAYNQSNANCAYFAALKLGVEPDLARKALEDFEGIARRFEFKGEYRGAEIYDDYSHHPTELHALIEGVRQKYPDKKIIMLFQPHTYSRTEKLFNEFVRELKKVDKLFILKTYASAREAGEDVSGKNLAKELNAPYFETHKEVAEKIKNELNSSAIFLTVGAGDGWQAVEEML